MCSRRIISQTCHCVVVSRRFGRKTRLRQIQHEARVMQNDVIPVQLSNTWYRPNNTERASLTGCISISVSAFILSKKAAVIL